MGDGELVRQAEIEGVSLNAVVNLLIARATGMTLASGAVRRRKSGR